MAGLGVQCWLQDLSSDLRLEEVLDKTIENALRALPGREFALLIVVEDELCVVRASGIRPRARRLIELWARASHDLLADPYSSDWLVSRPLLAKGRSLGVLVMLTPEDAIEGDDDVEILDAFVEQAALALANAHLFQTLLENATQDSLTELPNRREFDRLVAHEFERAGRYGDIFSLAMIDIDRFKELNDSRGHAAGDTLLRQVAETIMKVCRAADVPARLGGDEFALLLPKTSQFEAAALCERLRAEVESLADVSLSWGVAEYPTHGVKPSTLMNAADAAMYASKPRLVGGERAHIARSR